MSETTKRKWQHDTLVSALNLLAESYRELQDALIMEALEEPLLPCARCGRAMIPRRQWRALTIDARTRHLTCAQARGHCTNCYKYLDPIKPKTRRGKIPNVLSEEEVARLRRLVKVNE